MLQVFCSKVLKLSIEFTTVVGSLAELTQRKYFYVSICGSWSDRTTSCWLLLFFMFVWFVVSVEVNNRENILGFVSQHNFCC